MGQKFEYEIKFFKGLKNDEDIKQVDSDYFYSIKNFNYPNKGILGLEKILLPERITELGTAKIDGIFEYSYLDDNNVLQNEVIGVIDGSIYKDVLTTPILIKSGLTAGTCSFSIYNDKLFIANGKNYINIYDGILGVSTEMGAPFAVEAVNAGTLDGEYYYAMTYVTAGGEEVLGSVSNTLTVTLKQVDLTLPIGYTGTTSRKIYRTEAGGTDLKLVTTIADNTTLTYSDNIADGSLTTDIPDINNQAPKPYFTLVTAQKLYAGVDDIFPTQLFVTTANNEVIDPASFIDISNQGFDNTPLKGMGLDFGKIIAGSERNIFFVDSSDNSVILTRANVGIKNGYTVRQVPATAGFPGGLMFVSSLNDVRVMSGLQALPVSTSNDNVRTENWAQDIRGTLDNALKTNQNIYAEFFDYKYHLLITNKKFVFDVRTNGWTYHDIKTANYESTPVYLAVINNILYNGQSDGWIEQEYTLLTYRDEEVEAVLESPYMDASSMYKVMERFLFWFESGNNSKTNIKVHIDNNVTFVDKDILFDAGVFNFDYFSDVFFETDNIGLNYKVLNINRPARWIKYKLTNTQGSVNFQGFKIRGQQIKNRE